MKPEGFPRRLRLRRRREFLRVQRGGHKHHTRFFLVFVAPTPRRLIADSRREGSDRRSADTGQRPVAANSQSPGANLQLADADRWLPGTRLGVTVTRKVGKAVTRNRIKRLVREAFRRERRGLPDGLDMVWVAKRDASALTFDAAIHDMRTLAGRLTRGSRSR